MKASRPTNAPEDALERFSSWLNEVSPYHRAVRTPVYLQPEAPRLVRAFWETVGWSPVLGPPNYMVRPERDSADRQAMKIIRGWLSSPAVREKWGVDSPDQVAAAVRSRIPARSRFVFAVPALVMFTDESADPDDPPVLQMRHDGVVSPRCPRYLPMLAWQTCRKLAYYRGPDYSYHPIRPFPGCEQPFAPVFDEFWTLGDGVWAIGPYPDASGEGAPRDRWEQIIYRTRADYFRYVKALPDGTIEQFAADFEGMCRFAVAGARTLDPEHPTVPGVRRYVSAGIEGRPPTFHGLVEVDGARIWIQKDQGAEEADIFAEPEQAAMVRALIKREKLKIIEQSKPDESAFSREPTAAEAAAARKLHDKARAEAERREGRGT